uniref:Ovule protein n=1 Tax=Heterorhabditis bacteriophora TaxID=37862 RepID=A0A1I7WI55_HETBA
MSGEYAACGRTSQPKFKIQNDLPTSLFSKWSFLSHSIEQINHLTTVLTKQHTLRVPPDAQ